MTAIRALTCDNETDRRGAGNAPTVLTHLTDLTGRGLAVKATRTCSEAGCDTGGKLTRGLCVRCYARWIYNTPPEARQTAPRFARSFDDFVDRSGKCWIWTGPVNRKGYGTWSSPDGRGLAHRLSLARVSPPSDPSLFACHRCDNPPCVNPSHLYWGTASDNAKDAIARGRWHRPAPSEACPLDHAMEGDNLRVYSGKRFCRTCMNDRAREYQRRKRQEKS